MKPQNSIVHAWTTTLKSNSALCKYVDNFGNKRVSLETNCIAIKKPFKMKLKNIKTSYVTYTLTLTCQKATTLLSICRRFKLTESVSFIPLTCHARPNIDVLKPVWLR